MSLCSWRENNYTDNADAGDVAAIIMGLFVAETSSHNATDMLVYLMRHNMKDHKVKLSFSPLGIPFLFNSYVLTYVIVLKLSWCWHCCSFFLTVIDSSVILNPR